jgi:pimeloyl-ACP methyl ester carboxylesterase
MPARVPLAALVAAIALILPAGASAEPTPFGHACSPQDGVRFCPTTDLASRPASFDGTPIDVDVTLPATGDGPFPTILLLHGLGGTKTSFEGTRGEPLYNNVAFAQRGYAVVTPTARGFGNSCGRPSASSPGCEHGWTRLGDIRYEVRDIQTLVGQLVDEGIVNPAAIGTTGISYGGGFSTMLAFLKDRIKLENGSLAPWTSPKGTPISITAAWPRWLWTNGESIFTRNGRGNWSRTPVGVSVTSYAAGIFGVAFGGNVAPTGGELSTDLTLWKRQLDANRYGSTEQQTLDNAYENHGVAGLPRATNGPSPLLMQSGWTDALFPVGQSLAGYDAIRKADPNAPVALQFGDLGHGPGANHPDDTKAFDEQGVAFFDAWLRKTGSGPAPGSVTAFTMTCPKDAPSGGGPYTAASYGKLAKRTLRLRSKRTLRLTQKGASAKLAGEIPGLSGNGALCDTHRPDRTSHAKLTATSRGVTLLGQPVITGRVKTKGEFGQIAARVWDLNRKTNKQLLITRGVYRLAPNQKGRFRFTLDGNGWRFPKGHRIVVELLGRDSPTYGPSPEKFTARLTKVRVALPLR